jgi:alpha-L-fucosidase
MKKLLIFFIPILLFASDKIAKDIRKQFELLNKKSLNKIYDKVQIKYDPFMASYRYNKTKKNNKKKHIKQKNIVNHNFVKKNIPTLEMILNKYAFIDGKWYKSGEKIDNFIITKVKNNYVILQGKKKTHILKIKNQNDLIVLKRRNL